MLSDSCRDHNSTNKNEMITSACAKLPLVVHVRPGVKKSSASSSSTWVRVVFTKSTGYWISLLASVSRRILDNPWCFVMNHEKNKIFFHLGDGFKFEDRVAQHHLSPSHFGHCQLPEKWTEQSLSDSESPNRCHLYLGTVMIPHILKIRGLDVSKDNIDTLAQSYCLAKRMLVSCLHIPNCSSNPAS